VLEGLDIQMDEDKKWWLVNCHKGKKLRLFPLSPDQDEKYCTKELLEIRKVLKEELSSNNNEDFPNEYSEAPVARSKMFRTVYIPNPINRDAEQDLPPRSDFLWPWHLLPLKHPLRLKYRKPS